MFIFRHIHDLVQKELSCSEETVKKQLIELQLIYQMGEISHEEYQLIESELLQKFRNIVEKKQDYLNDTGEEAVE